MHHVQEVALSLFAERGFDSVSVEQVAEAAMVSPSTVYRYFATKEGLVLHDEFDDRVRERLGRCLAEGLSLADSLRQAVQDVWEDHFVRDASMVVLRARLFFEVPSVQGAVALVVNEEVDAMARVVADSGRLPFPAARVLTSGVTWALISVLRNWYDEGFTTDLRQDVEKVLGWWLPALDAATADLGLQAPEGPSES